MTFWDYLPELLVAALIGVLTLAFYFVFYPAITLNDSKARISEEVVSIDKDDSSVLLSFVIPAYNEEERLPAMLEGALDVIERKQEDIIKLAQSKIQAASVTAVKFEWVVVSDGSVDGTGDVVKKFAVKNSGVWKLVTFHTNSGKGYAVKQGMLHAKGSFRLMVDADGATEFEDLLALLSRKEPVVFGSRAHLEEASKAKRSFLRTFLMRAFHFFVDVLCQSTVRDTQCGFKLFTGEAAHQLFSSLRLQRWAFDIELVVLCGLLGFEVAEVGVEWQEVDGSKLDSSKLQLLLVSVCMLRDMLCVRLCYSLGIWRVKDDKREKNR